MTRRLPPGPHGLPPELVERNQRERLIAAMAEVCGERGYADTSVAEVSKRAGVSTASFYRQFKDKRECMLVSFEELFGRLLEAIERACAEGANAESEALGGVRAAAGLLAGDLPTARLLSVEIVSVGPEGVAAQHRAIDRLAALLRQGGGAGVDVAWARAAALVALVARDSARAEPTDSAEFEALVKEERSQKWT